MSTHRLSIQNGITIIEHLETGLRASVNKDSKVSTGPGTAILEATLYIEKGVFVKNGSYIFEAVDNNNLPVTTEVTLPAIKNAVDFFSGRLWVPNIMCKVSL